MSTELGTELSTAVEELERLVAASQLEQEAIRRFRRHYDQLPKDTPLPPVSLHRLREGAADYLVLQDRLTELAQRYQPLAKMDDERLAELEIDPRQGRIAVMVSLAAALTVYDNYLSMRSILEDDRLRRLANNPDVGYGIEADELRRFVEDLYSGDSRARVRKLLAWYEADQTEPDPETADELFLRSAIESSVSYRYAREVTLEDKVRQRVELARQRFVDTLDDLGKSTVGTLSKIFGNGVGLIEIRKGKLWQRQDVERHLLDLLQPLDLLLEKTPFRLTDLFIPGHFGHVAIWMGTYQELKQLGIWEHEIFAEDRYKAYREMVRKGHSVLEALRTGVELNTLEEFLNVDDLAVLRPVYLDQEEIPDTLIRAFRQVGKAYDFNFEVETTDKIVCSELAYHVYPGVDWQTDQQLGRFTISPDHVASEALRDSAPLKLVAFYHDGLLVDATEDLALMRQLMQLPSDLSA
ncbi:MAG: YiiX/YebB-like N1pC/P60 family cysteine hydrolase [Thermoanaerobaculia bacterium]